MSRIRLSVDDGCASDMRVAELASKYGIETIFYWPVNWQLLAYTSGYQPLDYADALHISKKFEVGSHTITHRHLTKIPEHEAMEEITVSKHMLERLFGVKITKFCPPRGYTNDTLTEYTLEEYKEQRLTKGPGLVHIHPNSGANGNKPWRECIDENTTEVWGHSWEWSKFNMWDEIEEFLREGLHS